MESAGGSDSTSDARPTDHRIKLNVGGKLFETTVSTLQSGGPDSLLAALSNRTHPDNGDDDEAIFIDRDPNIFAVLLSLLRSQRLPSTARRFPKQDLVEEALYYGIESSLRSAMSPPPLLGIDAALISTIRPTADGSPTAISAGSDDGSLWIAHGGQISSYDWNLGHDSTVRTHLDDISSLRRVWPEISAIGSLESPGLHFYDVSGGRHVGNFRYFHHSSPHNLSHNGIRLGLGHGISGHCCRQSPDEEASCSRCRSPVGGPIGRKTHLVSPRPGPGVDEGKCSVGGGGGGDGRSAGGARGGGGCGVRGIAIPEELLAQHCGRGRGADSNHRGGHRSVKL